MTTASSPNVPAPANRVGLRDGQISELTVIVPLKPEGAKQLRAFLGSIGGRFAGADKVGTLHDMRFVLLDDTKMLFATTYDGDWDSYINDFATLIPEAMDRLFGVVEGWPGITSPAVKDFIANHQITATGWYVAYPQATVADIRRGLKVRDALNALLDAAN
jgi:hypothetical protein